MAVNDELAHLQKALSQGLAACLKPHGILAVLSFHSLEDRMVKQAFRESKTWQPLLPKPLQASPAEQRLNPRSRTAKLRLAIRL
jgi:16S rRNA (cytosine1402-N4)-methyltransferase